MEISAIPRLWESAARLNALVLPSLAWAEDFARVASGDNVLGHVASNHRAGADDAPSADGYPGKNECARTDEDIFADRDLRHDERHIRLFEIMAAGAKICFLRNRGARADLNLRQTIGIGSVTQTRTIVQRQVPRHLDPGMRMYERCAVDLRAEKAQPKKPPRIQRLRSLRTKNGPADFPKSARNAIAGRPWRFVRGALRWINDLWFGHWNFETLNRR
jgi:hypothetical protein